MLVSLPAVKWFRFPRLLGILVCLYLVGITAVFGVLSQQTLHFSKHAATTEGTVVAMVARAPVGSSRNPPPNARTVSLAPKVTYVVDGRTYEYTGAHGQYRQRLRVGDRVQVQYDPSDPNVARIKGEGRVLVPGITIAFGLSTLLVAVILVRTRKVGVRKQSPRHGDDSTLDASERTLR